MRSIRLSLVVYLLLLLASVLGGVSWFVYGTTAQTLHDKVSITEKLLRAQYETRCEAVRATLDRRLLHQAQTLASLARSSVAHFEGLYPLGALSAALEPTGYLPISYWLFQGTRDMSFRLYRLQPTETRIESAEDVVGEGEYFQTYNWRGQPLERSPSLEESWFNLDDSIRLKIDQVKEHYDDFEMEEGLSLRRVTVKAMVPRFRSSSMTLPWRWGTKAPPGRFTGPAPPPRPPGGTSFESKAPTIFIQYASETRTRDENLAELQGKLDGELEKLQTDSSLALAQLRGRLLLTGLLTFLAAVLGGLGVVWLGLAPLDRLSEAVSKVSPRDFKLPIDENKLPRELQPIAAHLSQTLDQLKRVFAREKQAAADISHELRTPLAALLTTLDVGLKKQRTPEEYRELLEDCRRSGQHMNRLVERLLALARLDAGVDLVRPRLVDVADLAQQCANLVRPLAEARGLDLKVHTHGPAPLQADPDKLREILTNLLHNAIEYNRPEGAIELDVNRTNGHLRLAVKDTGIGIAPGMTDQIFQRFFRVDPSRNLEGSHAGLGLAIVKGYVDLMGGTIAVQSSTSGSTFSVDFPANGAGTNGTKGDSHP